MTNGTDRHDVSRRLRKLGVVAAVALGMGLVYVFLYAPMIMTAVFSVNDSTVQTLPFSGFTTKWYSALFADEQMKSAIVYSLQVAAVAVFVSACAALGFALLLHRMRFRATGVIQALLASPLVAPGLVLGISLLVVFNFAKVQPGFWTIIAGHASFITPLVMFILLQRLRTADPSLEQASMDCGAGPLRTFWHVTLPGVRVALVAACLLGFTLSMDEIAVTFFLAGTKPTLPVYVWGLLRFGFTPEVNAAFTVIAGGSLLLIAIAGILLAVSGRRQAGPEARRRRRRLRLPWRPVATAAGLGTPEAAPREAYMEGK
jgi:ABC-type spermidine/putrescine transport system permease subunit II